MPGKDPLEWQRLVAEYHASEESLGRFCNRHDVKMSTFHYWVVKGKRKVAPTKPVKMLPVIEPAASRVLDSVELVLQRGSRLRFSAGAAPDYIASIVKALA